MLTTKYTNRLSFISNIFFINHGNKIILYISKYTGNLPISIPPEKDDIKYNSDLFYELINKGISLIHNAHLLHDELESYYIKAMDFAFADNIYNKVINKLEKYE